jgi:putative endonuclease
MAFWAYILLCNDGSYYTGHTDDLDLRIGQHQTGAFEGYTSKRRPVTLVWSQDFPSRLEALEAERRIKGWSRAKKEALIRSDWGALSQLARNRQAEPSPSTGSGQTGEGTGAGTRSETGTVTRPVFNPVRAEPVKAHPSPNASLANPSPISAEPVEARPSTTATSAAQPPAFQTPVPDQNP